MQRGQAAIQARQLPEAEHWFRQAVAESPKDAQARACLGQTLCWQGRRDEGVAELRQSGQLLAKKARKSRDVGLLLGLAEQLQYWSDWPGSVELLKQATEFNPAEVRGFQLLALAHSRLNHKKSALAAGRQAVRLAPDSAMLQILLATLEIAEKLYEPARQRLEAVLQGRLTDEERFRAHKELAAILDKLKIYPEAFRHLQAAAEVSPRLPEVRQQDPALVPDMLRAGKAEFDRELLGRWAGTEFTGPKAPVFVMGFMRSGTTLTQEVLAAHPDVFLADETDLIVAVARAATAPRSGGYPAASGFLLAGDAGPLRRDRPARGGGQDHDEHHRHRPHQRGVSGRQGGIRPARSPRRVPELFHADHDPHALHRASVHLAGNGGFLRGDDGLLAGDA
jgi:Tfp pilus assembly protein PilF